MREARSTGRTALGAVLWGAGTIASSYMTLVVLSELAAHGLRANLGWGVFGLFLFQPPATLAVLIGAALLWRWRPGHATAIVQPELAELGPYRSAATDGAPPIARWSPRWILTAGLVWSCIGYLGFLFHNSGC